MARYVIANRRAGKFRESEKRASRQALESRVARVRQDFAFIAENTPRRDTDRKVLVVDTDPSTIRAMAPHSDVMIEPEIIHYPTRRYRPSDFGSYPASELLAPLLTATDAARRVEVRVVASGAALDGAEVLLFLRGPGGTPRQLSRISEAGAVLFEFPAAFVASALLVIPVGGFWTMVVRGPSESVTVDCLPLPAGPLGWWHRALGIVHPDSTLGRGIRVGVIDTGHGPHPALAHVTDVGAFIDGQHDAAPAGRDVDSHGTHVCGTIGAHAGPESIAFMGIAPGADLFCARVFPDADSGANQADIANAIDELSKVRTVDLINLSLGAPVGSEIEHDAIIDAFERGTVCVCAASNSAGDVEFPARFPECLAISALGRAGEAPEGTLSATRLPLTADRFGDQNLFLANFSCFGPEIAAAAPGVGIIATVPARRGLAAPYAAMDGTSMASPTACGALAALLSRAPAYQALNRDSTRSLAARQILRDHLRDVGLAPIFQGRGVPLL